jgi:uncharacterized protein YdiU (UPF0061 family)
MGVGTRLDSERNGAGFRGGGRAKDDDLRALFAKPAQIDTWLEKWRQRPRREAQSDQARQKAMQAFNPVYFPPNHQH